MAGVGKMRDGRSWKNERWQELGLLPCIMGCGLTGADYLSKNWR